MIVTLTPNPSIDRTVRLDRLVPGAVNRTSRARVEASGKGVNVTRMLRARGVPSIAVLPAGGEEGDQLLALLAGHDVPVRAVPVGGPVRVNISVVSPGGQTTKLNEPGPLLSADDAGARVAVDASGPVLAAAAAAGADLLAPNLAELGETTSDPVRNINEVVA